MTAPSFISLYNQSIKDGIFCKFCGAFLPRPDGHNWVHIGVQGDMEPCCNSCLKGNKKGGTKC